MTHPAIALIEQRISANLFDASHTLADTEIAELVRLATRAPSAYNLQNWRFIAVKTPRAKAELRGLAHGQAKVADAAVTFIVCGLLPDASTIPERLRRFVDTGYMSARTALGWQEGARAHYADPRAARDEAIRSATLGAATMMFAAAALGWVTSPMVGFDAEGVAHRFELDEHEIPVMLLPIGRAAPGNWPQKPRRPFSEVLEIA